MAPYKKNIQMDLFSISQNNQSNQLNLKRDVVFFDIESTGLNVLQDRIVQIALIKLFSDGRPSVEKSFLVNPLIPISVEAMHIHGITPDMVKDAPTFEAVSAEIFEFIQDSDLGGYNSDRFDLPLLTEELARYGLDLDMDDRITIDVQKIFYKMEPRTLKAAYQFYCDKELEGAHDALVDVRATVDVLMGQISKYDGIDYSDQDGLITKSPIRRDLDSIYQFIRDYNTVDFTQRLKRNQKGEIIFNFGKYQNQKVEDVFRRDKNYFHWIVDKDFSSQVKKIVRKIMAKIDSENNKS